VCPSLTITKKPSSAPTKNNKFEAERPLLSLAARNYGNTGTGTVLKRKKQ
jgi:hypothetical protein